MDVFHGNAGVIESHVIVAEIPKGFYPKLNEQGEQALWRFREEYRARPFRADFLCRIRPARQYV